MFSNNVLDLRIWAAKLHTDGMETHLSRQLHLDGAPQKLYATVSSTVKINSQSLTTLPIFHKNSEVTDKIIAVGDLPISQEKSHFPITCIINSIFIIFRHLLWGSCVGRNFHYLCAFKSLQKRKGGIE